MHTCMPSAHCPVCIWKTDTRYKEKDRDRKTDKKRTKHACSLPNMHMNIRSGFSFLEIHKEICRDRTRDSTEMDKDRKRDRKDTNAQMHAHCPVCIWKIDTRYKEKDRQENEWIAIHALLTTQYAYVYQGRNQFFRERQRQKERQYSYRQRQKKRQERHECILTCSFPTL